MSIFTKLNEVFTPKLPDTEKRGIIKSAPNFLKNIGADGSLSFNASASLGFSYVYTAASGISQDIASFDWGVFRKTDQGREEAFDHDQYDLIAKRPYFAYKAIDFRRAWVLNYLLTGDGYAIIIRNSRYGRPIGYRLVHKHNVTTYINYEERRLYYEVILENDQDGGSAKTVEVLDRDMLHLSDLSFNGLTGHSRVSLMRSTLEIAKRADNTQTDVNKNGTFLGGVIQIDADLKPEQLRKFRESFQEVYGGSKGEIAVLDAGAKFSPFGYSMSLADAEFITSRKFTGEEILRYFRYPNHMAMNLDGSATKSNMEAMAMEYVNYCLRPIVVAMEAEYNSKIFRRNKDKDCFVKGDLNSLLRGDIKSRMAMYEVMHKVGAMSANQILARESMNPIDNGDDTYVSLNTVPSSLAEEYYKAKIEEIRNKKEVKKSKDGVSD